MEEGSHAAPVRCNPDGRKILKEDVEIGRAPDKSTYLTVGGRPGIRGEKASRAEVPASGGITPQAEV